MAITARTPSRTATGTSCAAPLTTNSSASPSVITAGKAAPHNRSKVNPSLASRTLRRSRVAGSLLILPDDYHVLAGLGSIRLRISADWHGCPGNGAAAGGVRIATRPGGRPRPDPHRTAAAG